MKRLLYLPVFLLLASCVDWNEATQEVATRVQLVMPEETTAASLEGHQIVISSNSVTLTATTDAEGIATFDGIIPDVYDISCSWEVSGDEYRAMTGDQQVVSGATVAGSLNSYVIKDGTTILLETKVSVNRDIIIGKIYYAGSKDNNNRTYMAGKYLELYNQSDNDVDVSGLYVGMVEAESTQAFTLANLHEVYEDSVVLLKQVFRIPADEPFMVPAGGTVLIVNSAVDHTPNNDMENDLSDADFEAKDVSGRTQNNPETPAMELVYTMYPSVSNMNLVQSGPCGVVIFRTDDDVTALPKTYPYGKASGNQWLVLPKRMVIDGVECLNNKSTGIDVSTKRLYDDIDAGYTNISATSGWTGEAVYRKTAKHADDGHAILSDTNNSSNDFKVSSTIRPREYDE